MVNEVLQNKPDDSSHWSMRRMSSETGNISSERHAYLVRIRDLATLGKDFQALHSPQVNSAIRTHDYKRHGITALFAALDIATAR